MKPAVNPIALYFASGDSLYLGSTLLLIAVLSPSTKTKWLLLARNVLAWLGLALMIMACPPFAWLVDAIFLMIFGIWLVCSKPSDNSRARKLRSVTVTSLALLTVALAISEFRHRAMPMIAAAPGNHLVVLGDSISSGMYADTPAWPLVFQELSGIPVKNLSQPGARAGDGMAMATKVGPEDRMVLVELGGNDLLSGVPADEFAKSMESILVKIAAPNRIVVMFELPLLPNAIGYGRAQRKLAAKYGVLLIPKHYFTEVLGGAHATSDGLHLSAEGAQHMANLVSGFIRLR